MLETLPGPVVSQHPRYPAKSPTTIETLQDAAVDELCFPMSRIKAHFSRVLFYGVGIG